MAQQTTRLFSASSAARVATLVVALVAGGAAATPGVVAGAELGRLFFTPEERARLDELRNPKPEVVAPAPVVVEKPPEPPPPPPAAPPPDVPPIVVNGLVKRSDGNNTAWVNGMPTLTGDLSDSHIGVETSRIDGSRVPIRTPAHLPDVLLKPGQRFDPHGDLPVTDVIPGPVNGETPGRSSRRD